MAITGTCRHCKYWGVEYFGVCDRTDNTDHGTVFKLQATADDDQGLDAKLVTGPDFGCVLFAPIAQRTEQLPSKQ